MLPLTMRVVDISMVRVALPTIRNTFGLQADVTAWLDTAYTLPFVIFMPLYGRLGDGLGKSRLFIIGITVFITGTLITMLATDLSFLIIGRAIQGIGVAEIHPLGLALISERFSLEKRGKMLGTWSSVGAFTAMISPFIGGFLIVHLGWRTIFAPVLLAGLLALFAVWRQYSREHRDVVQADFLRTFDWGGVFLLSVATIMLVFYASSRPITGVEALRDWRLLTAAIVFLGGFVFWERRSASPFVRLDIFRDKNFNRASVGAGIRKFAMVSLAFLIPLYLADIYAADAATIGLMMTLYAGATLTTMRFGGQLADRLGGRWPIIVGSLLQVGILVYLALLPSPVFLGMVAAGVAGHGLGLGLTLAALERTALLSIPGKQRGMAAGLFNMIQFGGAAFGIALVGVILQYGLEQYAEAGKAYQLAFWFIAGVVCLGVIIGWKLEQ